MQTITAEIPDAVHARIQEYAQRCGRSASELVAEALEMLPQMRPMPRHRWRDAPPLDLGQASPGAFTWDDLLGEMTDERGH